MQPPEPLSAAERSVAGPQGALGWMLEVSLEAGRAPPECGSTWTGC